ncbi:hypothetical protein BDY24DRAFT_379751 [Mrakia frigida]|uniref:uncharacterized protein n=1 Tax=Mrakia frigida TaxID=29902 RepID=UPI003FCC0C62
MSHPWTLTFDALHVLPYFSTPTPIKGSSDFIQLTSNGLARALLIGETNFSSRDVPEREKDLLLIVGPSTLPSSSTTSRKNAQTPQTTYLFALNRAKALSVSIVLIAEEAHDVYVEKTRYVVLGLFNILEIEETQYGCRCLFEPNSLLNPLSLRLVPKNIWSGVQCSSCAKVSHIEDWSSLICSACSTPNHHQLPKPLTLAKLRPPQRMVAVGSRIDLGSPYIPSCVINSRLICLSDGSDVRSYQLELSPGKQVLVHHVFSKEGGGGLVVPNRALDAMQKRKVPLERMWNDGTTKTPAARLPIMTHLIGLQGKSCLPSFPHATSWADAEDWLLDVVEFMNVRSSLSSAGGFEFTQLLAVCQQPGLGLLQAPKYSPPTTSTFSFLSLGSDSSVTFRPRNIKSRKDDNLQLRMVQHGDVIVVEGDTTELDWIVSMDGDGEHFSFVAQHIPSPVDA